VTPPATSAEIFALQRPDRALWKHYLIRSLLSGPFIFFTLPYHYFRFKSLRYRFDDEGVHTTVGILFRSEVNLTYGRIQDIHLRSGVIQRWLGIADVQIQTASGNAGAELVVEGFKEFEAIRDFLYARMRGARGDQRADLPSHTPDAPPHAGDPSVRLLMEIRDELRSTRVLLEQTRNHPGDE